MYALILQCTVLNLSILLYCFWRGNTSNKLMLLEGILILILYFQQLIKQECVPSTPMPHTHYHFQCSMERSYHREHNVLSFKLNGLQLHQRLPRQKTLTKTLTWSVKMKIAISMTKISTSKRLRVSITWQSQPFIVYQSIYFKWNQR